MYFVTDTNALIQMTTILRIEDTKAPIRIIDNTFNNNSSSIGIIFIKQRTSEFNSEIWIHKNIFTKNAALGYSNTLNIQLFQDTINNKDLEVGADPDCTDNLSVTSNSDYSSNIDCYKHSYFMNDADSEIITEGNTCRGVLISSNTFTHN